MTLRYEQTRKAGWSSLFLGAAYVGDVLAFTGPEGGVRLFYRTRLDNGDIGAMIEDFPNLAALESFLMTPKGA